MAAHKMLKANFVARHKRRGKFKVATRRRLSDAVQRASAAKLQQIDTNWHEASTSWQSD